MGMFDNIRIEVPLPDGWVPDIELQTKDLDNLLSVFRITLEGRLVERRGTWVQVPPEERPYPDGPGILAMAGSLKLTDEHWVDVEHHGTIRFYGMEYKEGACAFENGKAFNSAGDEVPQPTWHEYEAKFTDGALTSISVIEQN